MRKSHPQSSKSPLVRGWLDYFELDPTSKTSTHTLRISNSHSDKSLRRLCSERTLHFQNCSTFGMKNLLTVTVCLGTAFAGDVAPAAGKNFFLIAIDDVRPMFGESFGNPEVLTRA